MSASPVPRQATPSSGPRFDLRFEAGRGYLRLAKPIALPFARLESLTLRLERVRFPLDVKSGAAKFRHDRTHAVAGEVRVDLRDLEKLLLAEGVTVRGVSGMGSMISLAVVDELGCIALDAQLAFEGGDLLVRPSQVRVVHEGASPVLFRLFRALRPVARFDAAKVAFRVSRPVRRLLAEALMPHGIRVPDERQPTAIAIEGREAILTIGQDAPLLDSPRDAEIYACVERGDLAAALMLARAARSDLAHSLALDAPDADGTLVTAILARNDDLGRTLRLRLALRARQIDRAVAEANAIDREEPVAELAGEALLAAAELAGHSRPALAYELARRATLRAPTDARIAVAALGLAEHAGTTDGLARIVKRAMTSALVSEARVPLFVAAAQAFLAHGDLDDAALQVEDALAISPGDADALLVRAELLSRQRDPSAVSAFDRAARAFTDASRAMPAARALARGAELLRARGDGRSAMLRLNDALALFPDDPELSVALARTCRAFSEPEGASSAYERLLGTSRTVAPALFLEAARFEVERGELESARAHLSKLARVAGREGMRDLTRSDPALAAFAERVLARGSEPPPRPTDFPSIDSREPPTKTRVDLRTPAMRAAELSHASETSDERLLEAFRSGEQPLPSDDADPEPEPEPMLATLDALARANAIDTAILDGKVAELLGRSPDDVTLRTLADTVAHLGRFPSRPDLLSRLESAASSDETRALYARSSAERQRSAGDLGGAARALARAGAFTRDMATVRAALELAEKGGSEDDLAFVIDLALSLVGDGPARDGLLARRPRG